MANPRNKRERVASILDDPDLYPDEFKAWVPRYLEGNVNFRVATLQLPQPEAVRYVGASGEAVFVGTWVNYGLGYEEAGYYKDAFGRVYLVGTIKSGTINTVAFTLPGGYRPKARLMFTGVDGAGVAQRLDVLATGDVIPVAGNNAFFSLSQVNFRAFG